MGFIHFLDGEILIFWRLSPNFDAQPHDLDGKILLLLLLVSFFWFLLFFFFLLLLLTFFFGQSPFLLINYGKRSIFHGKNASFLLLTSCLAPGDAAGPRGMEAESLQRPGHGRFAHQMGKMHGNYMGIIWELSWNRGKNIYEWEMFHCHVWLPDGRFSLKPTGELCRYIGFCMTLKKINCIPPFGGDNLYHCFNTILLCLTGLGNNFEGW